jgi:hypothetical protein
VTRGRGRSAEQLPDAVSPGAFDVIQSHEAVVSVHEDADSVEAQIARVQAGPVVFQPSAREAALTCSLALAQAFQG